jgi:hypothetical protein
MTSSTSSTTSSSTSSRQAENDYCTYFTLQKHHRLCRNISEPGTVSPYCKQHNDFIEKRHELIQQKLCTFHDKGIYICQHPITNDRHFCNYHYDVVFRNNKRSRDYEEGEVIESSTKKYRTSTNPNHLKEELEKIKFTLSDLRMDYNMALEEITHLQQVNINFYVENTQLQNRINKMTKIFNTIQSLFCANEEEILYSSLNLHLIQPEMPPEALVKAPAEAIHQSVLSQKPLEEPNQ